MHEGWEILWRRACWHKSGQNAFCTRASTDTGHVSSINTYSGSLTQPSPPLIATLKKECLSTSKTMSTITFRFTIKNSSYYDPQMHITIILFDLTRNL